MNKKNSKLNDFKSLLEDRRTYYSLEIYPPELYDEKGIIKAGDDEIKRGIDAGDNVAGRSSGNKVLGIDIVFDLNDRVELESEDTDDSFFGDDDENIIIHPSAPQKLPVDKKMGKIVSYMKRDWLLSSSSEGEIRELPFNKLTNWGSVDLDMYRLSEKFRGWIFIVYGKTELFVDNLWIKVYRNGPLIHASNNVEFEIRLKLPNGDYKSVDKNGLPKLDPDHDFEKMLNPPSRDRGRGIGDIMHMTTDLTMLFGNTIVDIGSLASEGAVAVKVLSVGLSFVDAMHQNMIRYGNNKGRCKKLYDRCNNILGALQNIDKETLNLGYVIMVVQQIEQSKKILENYGKQWRITRFFSSNTIKRKFININSDLSDSVIDFGVNYQIRQRIFKYKNLNM